MVGRRERLSYAAGDLGFNFVWQSLELYLLYYYIRGLDLSPATASAIFLAGAAVDWISDPVIGAMADRAAPRVPLRRWVVFGGPAAALVLVLAFTPPPLAGGWLVAVVLVTHILLRLVYSLGNIPYAALTARISSEPRDHLALTGTRMQGAALGGLIAALVYALLPASGGAGADFRNGALLLALLSVPAFLATWAGVRERIAPPPPPERRSPFAEPGAMIGLIVRFATLRRLLLTILATGLSVTVVNKSLLFLFEEAGATRVGYYAALLPALSLLVTTPLWALLAMRVGRVPTLVAAAAMNAAVLAILAVASGVGPALLLVTLAVSAGNGMSVMFWALVPAAIAALEREAGATGCAARVYALSTIARKLAQALAPQIVALGLAGDGSVVPGLAITALVALAVVLAYRPRGGVPPLAVRG